MNSIHDLRFLNLALLDGLMTVAIAVLISWCTRFRFRWVLPVCLGVAVLVYWALGEPMSGGTRSKNSPADVPEGVRLDRLDFTGPQAGRASLLRSAWNLGGLGMGPE
jgi:hypothetical protein